MNTLIEIKEQIIDQEIVQTVNARDLHAFLEAKRDFSNWIKDRITRYNFIEGQDFVKTQDLRSPNLASAKSRAVIAINYYLTLDRAKELSMLENNQKGREARLYFIECEKRVKQVVTPQIDYSSPKAMIGFLNYLQGQIDQKDTIIEDLTPKAMALESLQRYNGLFGLTETAKILEKRPKALIGYLIQHNWIYRRTPGAPLLPYQDKIKRGLMDCPTIIIQKSDGTEKVIPSAKVTTKGIGALSQELQRQNMH
ncbi:phage anti-repressor protein/phage antirepressor YoqD-like protein [Bartonella fuyuanensis]|uniref:Phage anti-repressor protein/phage antirepressor YoqD-like protein n=4 Tax=Bartonella TaxID=773 RepID=A0A840DZK6_9HYPH|nr:antA/AntB antirepressor family protein [Bartonella fuyuanensis]MBB4077103.1 phage anti-repressor protein/phage antirepressor YoqD-like protein [Bartonella fuyuanensis]